METSHFEAHESEFQPNVDYRSVVEKGEIVSTKHLEGYWPMSVVAFKSGSNAIFKATDDKLEAVISAADSAAKFDLVPSAAIRNVEGTNGIVQHIPGDSQLAAYYDDWRKVVSEKELIKAAAFDFVLDSKARTTTDLLVNQKEHKIFLINNDNLMLLDYKFKEKSVLFSALEGKGPINISQDLITGFQKIIDSEGKLIEGLGKREANYMSGLISRAKQIVEQKVLPV